MLFIPSSSKKQKTLIHLPLQLDLLFSLTLSRHKLLWSLSPLFCSRLISSRPLDRDSSRGCHQLLPLPMPGSVPGSRRPRVNTSSVSQAPPKLLLEAPPAPCLPDTPPLTLFQQLRPPPETRSFLGLCTSLSVSKYPLAYSIQSIVRPTPLTTHFSLHPTLFFVRACIRPGVC